MRTLAILMVSLLAAVAFVTACDRRAEVRASRAAQRAEPGFDRLIHDLDETLDRILAESGGQSGATTDGAARQALR
jgi:hypothetical protein